MQREPASRVEVERVRSELRQVERRVARLEQEARMRSAEMPAWFWAILAASIMFSVLSLAIDAGH